MNERERLMRQIQEYSFAAHEWNLYLDTHPTSKMGIEYFKQMSRKTEELKKMYAEKFGPLKVSDVNSDTEWTWATEPWPWSN